MTLEVCRFFYEDVDIVRCNVNTFYNICKYLLFNYYIILFQSYCFKLNYFLNTQKIESECLDMVFFISKPNNNRCDSTLFNKVVIKCLYTVCPSNGLVHNNNKQGYIMFFF